MVLRELLPRRRIRPSALGHPLFDLHRQMDHLLGDVFCDRNGPGADYVSSAFPALDISEKDRTVRLTAELPGLDEKDVTVTVEDNVLVISGEKTRDPEEEGRDWFRRERTSGRFRRAVSLSPELDLERIDARFAKGVLTVDVPRKVEEDPRRTIEIKSE